MIYKLKSLTARLNALTPEQWFFAMGIAVCTFRLLFYGIPSLSWPIYHDGPIMQYIAWRISEGAAPYRDIFDMNMPGTYLLHLACLKLLGPGDIAFRLFDLGFCFATCALIFYLARRDRLAALLGSVFFATYHVAEGINDPAQRDFLMLPFYLAACAALLAQLKGRDEARYPLAFSAGIACAFWIKPVIAVFALMGMIAIWRAQPALRLRNTALALAGFLVPSFLILAWLFANGGLFAFWDIILHFVIPFYNHFGAGAGQMNIFNPFNVGCDLLAYPILLWILFRHTSLDPAERTLLFIGFTYGFLHYYLQQKGWSYHAYPLWAFCGLYMGMVLPRLTFPLHGKEVVMLVMIALCAGMYRQTNAYVLRSHAYAPFVSGISADVNAALASVPESIRAPYLKNHPQQAVQFFDFTWAHLWQAAYYLHWIPPSRHLYPFPFYRLLHSPYVDKLDDELFHDLDNTRPLVILASMEAWPYSEHVTYDAIDNDPPWKAWFAEHYRLSSTNDLYKVYARKK